MIDAEPSLKAAEGLRATDLLAYLVGNGWSARPSRVDGISILSKDIPGADRAAEFILPVKPGFEEEQRRVADALRTIEAIEERPMSTIVNEIRQVAAQDTKNLVGGLPDWYAQLLRAEIKRIKDVTTSLEFAQMLVHAKDLEEVMRLQTEFVERQMQALAEQAQEPDQTATRVSKSDVLRPER